MHAAKALRIYDDANVIWQASSPYEKQRIIDVMRIHATMPEAAISISPALGYGCFGTPCDGNASARGAGFSTKPPDDIAPSVNEDPRKPARRFLVQNRGIKNLDGALRLLQAAKGKIDLDIYGPVEDMLYWRLCQNLIRQLPANVHVRYCGTVNHADVPAVFASYDLFLFPTHGENYGHVIAEAMLAGCPVLISDATPWRDLEKAGAGWDIPLTEPESFAAALNRCINMDGQEHDRLRQGAIAFVRERTESPGNLERNRALFRTALSRIGQHGRIIRCAGRSSMSIFLLVQRSLITGGTGTFGNAGHGAICDRHTRNPHLQPG